MPIWSSLCPLCLPVGRQVCGYEVFLTNSLVLIKIIIDMKQKISLIIFLALTGLVIAGICLGDTIIFREKDPKTKQLKTLEGKVLETDKEKVVIEIYPGKKKVVPKGKIKEIIKGAPPWEVYEQKKKKIKDIAKDHYELGKWCQEHNLKDEAQQELSRVIELDPDHKDARKALGYVKDDNGEWRQEEEVMLEKNMVRFEGGWAPKEKLPELMKKGSYALIFKIAIEDDVDDEFMKYFEEHLNETAVLAWQMLQGQFYISEISVEDKTSKGNVIIEKGLSQTNDYSRARADGIGYNHTMFVPGKYFHYTFLHEIGHARLGLPDEKKGTQVGHCPNCIMCGYSEESVRNLLYCDENNHTGNGPSCWELILQHWPKLVGPTNMNFSDISEGSGRGTSFNDTDTKNGLRYSPPATKITIKNN